MQDTALMLHTLLELGESMLADGADVRRVEQTLTRMGLAYGAVRMDVFVITSSIVLFFAIVLLEALDHIVPYMKTVCESYASADLVRQLPVLLGGMAVYALEVWLAYRKSAARFEKVDL